MIYVLVLSMLELLVLHGMHACVFLLHEHACQGVFCLAPSFYICICLSLPVSVSVSGYLCICLSTCLLVSLCCSFFFAAGECD